MQDLFIIRNVLNGYLCRIEYKKISTDKKLKYVFKHDNDASTSAKKDHIAKIIYDRGHEEMEAQGYLLTEGMIKKSLTAPRYTKGSILRIPLQKEKAIIHKLKSATEGDELYIAIETESIQGIELRMNLKTDIQETAEKSTKQALRVQYRNEQGSDEDRYMIAATVGEYAKKLKNYVISKEEFKDWAMIKLKLTSEKDDYDNLFKQKKDAPLNLFLLVAEPITQKNRTEKVFEALTGIDYTKNSYYKGEGKWFTLEKNKYQIAPWMEIAWQEYEDWNSGAWTEKTGDGMARAQKYINGVGLNFPPTGTGSRAWCACFAGWVLRETNMRKDKSYSVLKNTPESSLNFWFENRYKGSKKIEASLKKNPIRCNCSFSEVY